MTALQLSDVDVKFGGLKALGGFNLVVRTGEIHGLIGPNGAGKSTAINVSCGLVVPAAGEVRVAGERLPMRRSELAARGLARTFQAPAVFQDLSPLQNVMVGHHFAGRATMFGVTFALPWALREDQQLREEAINALRRVGFQAPLDARTSSLSYGAHRKIEIARALLARPRLLLLDEPTAGLTPGEIGEFSKLLRELRAEDPQLAILLVEHNVPFVFGLCDRVTAMAEGRTIGTGLPAHVRELTAVREAYLGTAGGATTGAVSDPRVDERQQSSAVKPTEPILEISGLSAGYTSALVLRDISLNVAKGELVALIGRNGAGKTTLLGAIAGAPRPKSGMITHQGFPIQTLATEQRIRLGLGLVPQNGGVLSAQTVQENLDLAAFAGLLRRRALAERREEIYSRFRILAERRNQLAGTLSGGERQMLAIAKVLMRRPQLLMLDEPSIGLAPVIVDRLAEIVRSLRQQGLTILVAEQNLRWLAPMADRAYLLETGRIASQLTSDQLADDDILANVYLGSTGAADSRAEVNPHDTSTSVADASRARGSRRVLSGG